VPKTFQYETNLAVVHILILIVSYKDIHLEPNHSTLVIISTRVLIQAMEYM